MHRFLIATAVIVMSACAGEKGPSTFELELRCRNAGHCQRVADPFGVGVSQVVELRSRAYHDPGFQMPLSRDQKYIDVHPIEDVVIDVQPPGVFEAALQKPHELRLAARTAGSATLTIEGTVRGHRSKVTVALTAVPVASTRFELADKLVGPGDEIALVRGVRYLAIGYLYDAQGRRLQELRADATTAPLWQLERPQFGGQPAELGHVWSDKTGAFALPAFAGSTSGRVRFVDPKLKLERRGDTHVNLVAVDDNGVTLPIAGIEREAVSADCVDASDMDGIFAMASIQLDTFDPKATCKLILELRTEPEKLHPSLEVTLPLQRNPDARRSTGSGSARS